MSICYGYYNLIVAAAVVCSPSSSSIHDGAGELRIRSVDKIPRTMVALRRAMALWTDNFVRSSTGDAVAPAASLAVTAIKAFADAHPKGRRPNACLMGELKEFELAPGLHIVDLITTCLCELGECAASGKYSIDCLEMLANNESPLTKPMWDKLPKEKRAEVVLAIVRHFDEHGTKEQETDFRGGVAVPREALLKLFDYACKDDVSVVEMAAQNEMLGYDNPGHNTCTRSILHYCLSTLAVVNGGNVARIIDRWSKMSQKKKKPCQKLAEDNIYCSC